MFNLNNYNIKAWFKDPHKFFFARIEKKELSKKL